MSNENEPTMRYRPDHAQGARQSAREDYWYKVFEGEEVDSCLKNGWYKHWDDFPKKKK